MPPTPKNRVPRNQGSNACLACRRRKSRCKYEPGVQGCLMCRSHQTQCIQAPRAQHAARRNQQQQQQQQQQQSCKHHTLLIEIEGTNKTIASTQATHQTAELTHTQLQQQVPIAAASAAPQQNPHTPLSATGLLTIASEQPDSAISLETTEEENPHIVGPATASDSHFLDDYLSSIHTTDGGLIVRPVLPGATATPVVFMKVKKRPIGLSPHHHSISDTKLETIIKLLEPHHLTVMKVYFERGNICFPILHQGLFQERTLLARSSPAVLACIYAHTMCYWNHDVDLQRHRRPDGRFIWNLALDALYHDLHMSPGMPSIIAILLNIGGRPTTTMVGNGMLLGCAISLAKSLGLNRNPSQWAITQQEKTLRVNIWWCLVIHDRWTSLTHGTPPHISQSHHDIPLPILPTPTEESIVFETLASLTVVLGTYIEELYTISIEAAQEKSTATKLLAALISWSDSLSGEMRKIIIRGNNLNIPGAANLRLCYLAARFYGRRLELSGEIDQIIAGQPPNERLLATRRSAEDIVLFVLELSVKQLGDFWLPHAAFVFSSIVTFLVRLAIQTELPTCETTAQSLSLSLANDLISSLRMHKDVHDWELGDVCVTQYGNIVDRLWGQSVAAEADMSWADAAAFGSYPLFLDAFIEDQWDPFSAEQIP